jgi:hypothetical protein
LNGLFFCDCIAICIAIPQRGRLSAANWKYPVEDQVFLLVIDYHTDLGNGLETSEKSQA